MANICRYKVIVMGKKTACFAFFGSMPCANDKYIVDVGGTDESCIVKFEGDCKWAVDAYCEPWSGSFPVVLPDNPENAMEEAAEKYMYTTIHEKSKIFEVEVWCNSADIEDYDPAEGPDQIFEHYLNGEPAGGVCPEELAIKGDSQDGLDMMARIDDAMKKILIYERELYESGFMADEPFEEGSITRVVAKAGEGDMRAVELLDKLLM